jgi:20S proteasome alpha/beta subunit
MRLFLVLALWLLGVAHVLASLNHILGIQCKDGVLLSASSKHGMSVLSLKDDVENIRSIGDCLVGFSGHSVLCDHLYNSLDIQNKRSEMTLGRGLSTSEVLGYCRSLITGQYRGIVLQQEQEVFGVLIAGFDEENDAGGRTPILYWINEFGETFPVPYAAHGVLASSLLSFCDRIQTDLMNEDTATTATSATATPPHGWRSLSKEVALRHVEEAWETLQRRSNIVLNRVHTKWLAAAARPSAAFKVST